MKLYLAIAFLANAARVAAQDTYTPANDVTDHSRIALDARDIIALLGTDNAAALDIYVNGKNRANPVSGNLQAMARKDWVASGATDEVLQSYITNLGAMPASTSTEFLDTYNLDAIQCSGTFAGESATTCAVAAEKNLFCTMLVYSQYEGAKSVNQGTSKNWDELFAFWHGIYDAEDTANFGKYSPHNVQNSRDGNFDTSFRCRSFDAISEGKTAVTKNPADTTALSAAFDKFNQANAATFAGQATLRYAHLAAQQTVRDDIDDKWAEGYTYFRCGAGLLESGLAMSINEQYDPRGKNGVLPDDLFCTLLKEMISIGDIGQGITVKDLKVLDFLPDAVTLCGVNETDLTGSTFPVSRCPNIVGGGGSSDDGAGDNGADNSGGGNINSWYTFLICWTLLLPLAQFF